MNLFYKQHGARNRIYINKICFDWLQKSLLYFRLQNNMNKIPDWPDGINTVSMHVILLPIPHTHTTLEYIKVRLYRQINK